MLFLWFGSLLTVGATDGWQRSEVALAALLVFVIRPLMGLVALSGLDWDLGDRFRAASLGIRGMGSIFHIAFAQGHGTFNQVDVVWRVAIDAILLSVLVHGLSAASTFDPDDPSRSPGRDAGGIGDEAPEGDRLTAR